MRTIIYKENRKFRISQDKRGKNEEALVVVWRNGSVMAQRMMKKLKDEEELAEAGLEILEEIWPKSDPSTIISR